MKKKTYEVPAMQVVQFKSEQPLMVGSSVSSFGGVDNVQEWDIDSDED